MGVPYQGPVLESLPLASQKIGEGRFREVFEMGDYVIKLLKPTVTKKKFGMTFNFATNSYTSVKFDISDFNNFEYLLLKEAMQEIPPSMQDRFVKIYSTGQLEGRSYSISERVANQDGTWSKPLAEYGQLDDGIFWKNIDELEALLEETNMPFMDVRGENILVKESGGEKIPVLIDFKRVGRDTYPFQFWLRSDKKLFGKMHRRFDRLREKYQVS